jgi:protein-S-isoprenylcysteine O-methyltransferase Ste14
VPVNMRTLRLRAVWLLVLPFLWFAHPNEARLWVGAGVAILGLLIRGWAAGTIRKEEELTTSGPYAFTRNPLYLGSLLIGLGVTWAGGGWLWPAVFLVFFGLVYTTTMRGEARLLTELFGARYRDYAANVPAFVPRPTPYRAPEPDSAGGFGMSRYARNREWEALLGVITGFALLASKWWWL